jgi:hypothetical protein
MRSKKYERPWKVCNPVFPEPLQQLIKAQAALLGEDGDAIIQDIQEEAEKDGKLPADIFKLIESCRMDLGKRAALQELSNEIISKRAREAGASRGHTGASNQV